LAIHCGDGNDKDPINELTRAVYLIRLRQQMSFGALPFETYAKSEAANATARASAPEEGDGKIASGDTSRLKQMLALHDEQLANVPRHCVVDADKHQRAFIMEP
jgi:hypothetical protein